MEAKKHPVATCTKLLSLVLAALVLRGCAGSAGSRVMPAGRAADGKTAQSSALPPLVVDKNAPLLLDEPAGPETPATTSGTHVAADNTTCFVCHANYSEEPMAVQHASAGVGCENCHGKSIAHKNDENNTTPPDIMYPSDKIDPACQVCHSTHDAPARQVIARLQERCPTKKDPQSIVCTDCHGEHRLKRRSVRWDKKTGKLIRAL